MKKKAFPLLFLTGLLVVAGCKPPASYRGPEIKKPVVQTFAGHPAGSGLQALIEDFNLVGLEVRERRGLPGTRKSEIYFLDEGNLHVEAAQNESGDWLLLSVPYLEPSDTPVADRVSKWDAAVVPDQTPLPAEKK
jgi:hypothetical protein